MDVYFIRRILDKDYILNSVVYSGVGHTVVYLYILIKYFNFDMTHHSAYNSDQKSDLEKLTNSVKNAKNIGDIYGYFKDSNIFQCTDMSNFPKNFE